MKNSSKLIQENTHLKETLSTIKNVHSKVFHRIGSSINAFDGLLSILTASHTPQNPQLVDHIEDSKRSILTLIKDFGFYITTITQKPPITTHPLQLQPLLNKAYQKHNNALTHKNITLTDTSHGTRAINGNPTDIQFIIDQLINNAITYSPNNAEIIITSSETPQNITLKIHNTHTQIPTIIKQQCFKTVITPKNHKNSGLSLLISHHIMKFHNGTIKINNLKNKVEVVLQFKKDTT
jgi:signal transduction histidine kinase